MPFKQWQEMTQRAAAGAINGGGQVPKGFAPQTVTDGISTWEKMQKTSATGVKAKAWGELKSAVMWFKQPLKAAPLLTKLSAVTLSGSAIEIGWKIGGGEGSIWSFIFGGKEGGEPVGGTQRWEAHEYIPRDAGESGCFEVEANNTDPCGTGTSPGATLTRPLFQLLFKEVGKSTFATAYRPGKPDDCPTEHVYGSMPVGVGTVFIKKDFCAGTGKPDVSRDASMAYTEIGIRCIPGQTTEGCTELEPDQWRETSPATALEGPEATEKAEECFRGEAECGALPGWWWNHDPIAQEDSSGLDDLFDQDPLSVVIPAPAPTEVFEEYGEVLEELELVPDYIELPFEDADAKKKKDVVIFTKPTWGTAVQPESTVQVHYNPDYRVIPQIAPLETYDEYAARIEAETGLKPQKIPLPEYATDPKTGPEGASYTVPGQGTTVAPGSDVKVHTNPPTAPDPVPGPAWSPPPVSGLNLQPLAGIAIGCNKFPFGVFCWIGDGLTGAGSAGACPTIGVPMGSSVGLSSELGFDLCAFEPAMVIVRPVLVLLAAFSLAYMFAAAAMGFGGGSNED